MNVNANPNMPRHFEKVEDTSFEVFDRHTQQTIRCNRLMSPKEICGIFRITKGQLNKAVERGEFPKATTLLVGHLPRWADSIVSRVKRVA
jgi:hypothetical protein